MRNAGRCVGAALVIAAVCWILGGAMPAKAADEKQGKAASADKNKSYYESLMDLVADRRGNPKPKTAEQLVIDPPKGAIGVTFGQTMDDLVAVWGKPDEISMDEMDDIIRLSYKGGLRFGFRHNKLFEITIAGLDGAHFKDGPALDAPPDQVKTALGEPRSIDQRDPSALVWTYEKEDVTIELRFFDSKLGFVTLQAGE